LQAEDDMPRRRTISEREQKRREKQRKTPPPDYAALYSEPPPPSQLREVAELRSAGARSALLAPRPPPTFSEPPPLLHTRAQACRMLSCSTATLIRLEQSGRLRPIKLNPDKKAAQVYYAHTDLILLASGR
jgi:hypothetical protein